MVICKLKIWRKIKIVITCLWAESAFAGEEKYKRCEGATKGGNGAGKWREGSAGR